MQVVSLNLRNLDNKLSLNISFITNYNIVMYLVEVRGCKDYLDKGINITGNYYINGSSNVIEDVFCDFTSLDYSTCHDYHQAGFNVSGEYNVYLNGRTYTVDCDFSSGK